MKSLHKMRSCFVYENQAYTIDTIKNVEGKPTFLRAETLDDNCKIPPFIKVVRDVTEDRGFSGPGLARQDFKFPPIFTWVV